MRVCLLSAGQPSNNPRLVKEADAFTEVGHEVHAICTDSGLWPTRMDGGLMEKRRWTFEYAGGAKAANPIRHYLARVRHRAARELHLRGADWHWADDWALSAWGSEIAKRALKWPADLYIAHHPSVLSAAVNAASRHGGLAAYDIEDIYQEIGRIDTATDIGRRLIARTEAACLPMCDFVTTASPLYGEYYRDRYGVARATTILNVFPKSDRPLKRERGLPDGPLRLYWFSQVIGRDRGLEDAVAAIALLKDEGLELHVRGHWSYGYREEFYRLVEQAGVNTRTIVEHEPAPPDEMVRLAGQYDVGLALEQPCDRNRTLSVPNKILVYLLAGMAVAATNLPGHECIARLACNSVRSYAPGDSDALAAIFRRFRDDRNALDEARLEAWRLGDTTLNWETEKQKLLASVSMAAALRDDEPRNRAVAS